MRAGPNSAVFIKQYSLLVVNKLCITILTLSIISALAPSFRSTDTTSLLRKFCTTLNKGVWPF